MTLSIGLPLRNRDALTNLLAELYNPSSPQYHHFLTQQQFADQFGPTEQDQQAVIEFAKSNQFAVTRTHRNRMLVDVVASAEDIERAFHLKLRKFQHPTESRAFYAPDSEPSVDRRLPVLSISGLDNFVIPHPMGLRSSMRTAGNNPLGTSPQPLLSSTGSGPAGTFLGRDFRKAYAPGVPLDGAGESVGLVEFDGYFPSDISDYEDVAGIPQVPLTNVLVNGVKGSPGQFNWEVALDIEMVVSMAPGLSRVIVYEGVAGNDILNQMASDNLARQLSCSWSFGAPVDPTRDQIFQQFAAQGQSFFQASGDGGAYGRVITPADDPLVTAVGGTSLVTGSPDGAWSSEIVWPNGGGGISPNHLIPLWQKPLDMSSNQGSISMRNVPDVAALADNVIWNVANNGQQGTIAGTSAAAPLWAGFVALVNQQAAANHQPPVGFLNPALYAIGGSSAYSSCFHDIAVGDNTTTDSPNRFFAVPGYDLCTGWGTPNGSNLITALLAPPDSLQIYSSSNNQFVGPLHGPFVPNAANYTLSNSGPANIGWDATSSASWFTVAPSSGVLPAFGATSINLNLTSAASALSAGVYQDDLWITNLSNGFGQHRLLTLRIATVPSILVQPTNQTVPAGATVQLAVSPAPNASLAFQWQSNGVPLLDSGNIFGAQSALLILSNVTAQNSANYSVRLSSVAGSITSSTVTLSVTSSPPLIIAQPISQTALPGADVLFSVTAYGDAPLSYQWRKEGQDLKENKNVGGATSPTLVIKEISAADAGNYSVIASNSLGTKASSAATLNVMTLTSPGLIQRSVYSFSGKTDGGHPKGLTLGQEGVFYSATQSGGSNDSGTIFVLETNGVPRTLHLFSGLAGGLRPNGELAQDSKGTLFGTTYGGGTNGFGTLYQLDTNQVFSTLFALDRTNGVLPTAGLTRLLNGILFGTGFEGGIYHYGTVFRFDPNSGFAVVFAFGSTNGAFPRSNLMPGSDGNLYGTTYKGGAFGSGTMFSVTPAGLLTVLGALNGTNGAFPVASLTEGSDAAFYGCATSGGAFGQGTIFRMLRSGSVSLVYSFTGGPDGGQPRGSLILGSDGNFYGTTSSGGSFGAGTVYRLSPDGVLTTIAQFDGFNGANPEQALVEAPDGSWYGSALNGGAFGEGVIFHLNLTATAPQMTAQPKDVTAYAGSTVAFSVAAIGTPALAYQWQHNGTNVPGAQSRTLLLTNVSQAQAGSYTAIVTNGFGSAQSSSATLQVLESPPFFTRQPTNQTSAPGVTIVLDAVASGNAPLTYQWLANGIKLVDKENVFGALTPTLIITNATEANNGVYSLVVTNQLGVGATTNATVMIIPVSAPGTILSTVHFFNGNAEGRSPSELVDSGDGFLYGTTAMGGQYRQGTVFRFGTNRSFNTVYSFDLTNGALPEAGLALGTNGLLYGTASAGGDYSMGSAFSLSGQGQFTQLHSFTGSEDGGVPRARLAQTATGDFVGSCTAGGIDEVGTLFRMSPAGDIAMLYSFTGGPDGHAPSDMLLPLVGAELYGTTSLGGAFTNGSVFRLTGGGLANIYSFTGGFDGYAPVGALAVGDDGSLYGATRYNTIRGFPFYGTIFKLLPSGALTTLYSLNFTDGFYPAAGLVLALDGNFYGTTESGGVHSAGTVFRISPSGQFSTLVDFDGFNDGAKPLTALTQGSDGNLYGTTSTGGPGGGGTIYRLGFTGPPQITGQPANQTGATGGNARFSVAASGGMPFQYQWRKDGTNLVDDADIHGASTRILTFSNLTLTDKGAYSVVVANSAGNATSLNATLNVVEGPPVFQSIHSNNGILSLSWSSASNRVYQLQFKASVSSNWSSVGNPVTAVSNTVSASLSIGPGSEGFYRVVLLP